MIIMRIMPGSGMGNQMFMYAAGLSAATRLGTKLRLGAWNFDNVEGVLVKRPYSLHCFAQITEPNASFTEAFRIVPGIALRNLIDGKPNKQRGFLRRFPGRIVGKLLRNTGRIYRPDWYSYSPDFLNIKDNTYIVGYFESERIFEGIPELIRKKFTFAPKNFDPTLSEKVRACNSVAVHIRRGDKSELDCYSDGNYIKAALEKISSMIDNPKFFVFSDGIDWCKKNLPQIYDAEYNYIEGQTQEQDMALMTQCKHVIMGPSTFSWWGAWLNDNPQKIVIAPGIKIWGTWGGVYHGDLNDRKYLLPERWIKID